MHIQEEKKNNKGKNENKVNQQFSIQTDYMVLLYSQQHIVCVIVPSQDIKAQIIYHSM